MVQEKQSNGLQGFTFGIMEGTILLMGLMLGLSVTGNKAITVLALLVTALSDAFANSAGFHVSQETEKHHSSKEVWASTIYCFAATFLVMAFLVIPILVFENYQESIIVSSALAIIVLGTLGVFVARSRNESALHTAIEYILMGVSVAIICYFLGAFAESIITSVV
jgi:VIT1/CCC1 family predicted Fe2+/Mn2+ transporter